METQVIRWSGEELDSTLARIDFYFSNSLSSPSAVISENIPKYSRIDSAVFKAWVKRSNVSSNANLDVYLAKDNRDSKTATILTANGWISSSYKQFASNDIKAYFNSKNADAGQRLNSWNKFYTHCNADAIARHFYFKGASLEIGYTQPTVNISVSAGAGGNASSDVSSLSLKVPGQSYSAALTATPLVGYKFSHWSDGNTSATRTITYSDNNISAFETNVSYTAVFAPITYSVVFSGSSAVTHSFDTAYALPSVSNSVRKVNLIDDESTSCLESISRFLGWHDENPIAYGGTTYSYPAFSAAAYYNNNGDLIANIDSNIYNKYSGAAHYHNFGKNEGRDCSAFNGAEDCYLIKYQVKNLSATENATVTLTPYYSGYSSVTLPIPSKEGYNFLGWYDENDNFISSGGAYTPASDISLYAKWEKEVIPSDFRITEAFMLKSDNEIVSASSPIAAGQGFILKVKIETV